MVWETEFNAIVCNNSVPFWSIDTGFCCSDCSANFIIFYNYYFISSYLQTFTGSASVHIHMAAAGESLVNAVVAINGALRNRRYRTLHSIERQVSFSLAGRLQTGMRAGATTGVRLRVQTFCCEPVDVTHLRVFGVRVSGTS